MIKKIIFMLILILVVPVLAFAQTYYVRPGATGDGSDWTNAYTVLPATLVRGATYYIAGGNYAAYDSNNVAGTDWITIKKATVAEHGTDTGWDDSYGTTQALFDRNFHIKPSYVVLDGAYRGDDWRSGYGIKILTQYANRYAKSMRIGEGLNPTNITVKHVEIEGSGDDLDDGSNDLVYLIGSHSYITFQYCYFQMASRSHFAIRNSVGNNVVEYSYFYHNESHANSHSQSMSCTGDDWTVRYNVFDTIEGTGVVTVSGSDWKVYGNVFYNYHSAGNGIFTGWSGGPVSNSYFYNNTVVDSHNARIGMENCTNIITKNNIFFNNTRNLTSGTGTRSHNAFGAGDGTSETFGTDVQTGIVAGDFVNYAGGNFRLSGATTSGDTTIGATYNTDMDGKTRGQDGVWDRGAFEYDPAQNGEEVPSISAPSGLRVVGGWSWQ